MLIVVLTGWLGENPTWATSCPQHQGVQDKIGEVNGQAQALPVPPSLEKRGADGESIQGMGKGIGGCANSPILFDIWFHPAAA
jgi:hypothetical protein